MSELKNMNPEQGGHEEPQKPEAGLNDVECKSTQEEKREEGEELVNGGMEKEATSSATSETRTLPWPEDRGGEQGEEKVAASSENKELAEEVDERGAEKSGAGQSLTGGQSQPESERKAHSKWRESMPEGDRWEDEEIEMEGEQGDHFDGSLADSEEKNWMPAKAALVFTPQVNIVRPPSKQELPHENKEHIMTEKVPFVEPQTDPAQGGYDPASPVLYDSEWTEREGKYTYMCDNVGSDAVRLSVAVVIAAVLFPLMVWGGYALLPFDAPLLDSAPLRVMYTLRCSFFAIVPIMLGVLVQGVARLRYGALTPLYEGRVESREVLVHWHYVSGSLDLFLFYFLQLAVMATYISQDLLKLVPLLTIVFTFGRLIYWVCVSLGSTIRGVGFGLSFFPTLVMLGANLYFVCSSLRAESVFDVAPPTTAPPPKPWWFG